MDKHQLSGRIKAHYVGIKGMRVEIFIDFSDDTDLASKLVYLEGSKHWELHAPVDPVGDVVARSKSGKGPHSCPKHGDAKIYKNKRGGDHTHYCAVKEGEGLWCGQKIYR